MRWLFCFNLVKKPKKFEELIKIEISKYYIKKLIVLLIISMMKKSKVLWLFMAILVIVNLVLSFLGDSESQYMKVTTDLLPVLCSVVSVICLIAALEKFTEFDFTKKAWLLIFLGIVLFMLAENLYAILELWFKMNMNESFPSAADIFWYMGYIPLFIGLGMIFLGYKRSGLPMGKIKMYVLLGIIVLLVVIVITNILLIPIIQDPESNTLTKISSLFYPIADMFIVIPAALLVVITNQFGSGKISVPWRLLATGFLLFTISDLLYSYFSWIGTYKSGSLVDIGWNAGYLFLGLAGLYQKELIESIKEDTK